MFLKVKITFRVFILLIAAGLYSKNLSAACVTANVAQTCNAGGAQLYYDNGTLAIYKNSTCNQACGCGTAATVYLCQGCSYINKMDDASRCFSGNTACNQACTPIPEMPSAFSELLMWGTLGLFILWRVKKYGLVGWKTLSALLVSYLYWESR